MASHLSTNQYSSDGNLKGMEDIPTANQKIERETHVSIEMVTSIRGTLESLPALSSKCCIYRVTERIRELNLKAYTPRVVSIGPFHPGEKRLQGMEEHKFRYLRTFIKRTERSLEDYLEVVRTWEERARHCYAEAIELSSDEFVKMILVDGGFIVELLLRDYFPHLRDESDRLFHKPWMSSDVWEDMMLLENQLPFFVLEGLFDLVSPSIQEGNLSFLDVIHGYFKHLPNINKISSHEIEHFVDFIRCSYLSSFPEVRYKYECPPSVTKLHEAGIKFKAKTSCSFFDIEFIDGILKIPHLVIDGRTGTLLRNLIAFEQCHYEDKYFIQYMCLLDDMINTSKDVDLLIQHGIITSMLGNSEDVLELFNKICKEVAVGNKFYFSSLCEKLNTHCRAPWHKWNATLKRDYFNTPWAVVSFIAALVLLVLTFIQTVASVKSDF